MPLTKITVNLSDKTYSALDRGTIQAGGTKTDFINKSIQLYEFILQQEAADRTLWVRDGASLSQVKIF